PAVVERADQRRHPGGAALAQHAAPVLLARDRLRHARQHAREVDDRRRELRCRHVAPGGEQHFDRGGGIVDRRLPQLPPFVSTSLSTSGLSGVLWNSRLRVSPSDSPSTMRCTLHASATLTSVSWRPSASKASLKLPDAAWNRCTAVSAS